MTTYLLDTHYLIWAITDTKKIPKKLKNILADTRNEIVVSVISFWEVSLKFSLGKLKLNGFTPEDLPQLCEAMNFKIINLSADESSSYHQLATVNHRDPFDRMLISQSLCNDFIFVSSDANVQKYTSIGLKIYQEK